jgi:hypothetical protein
LFSRLSDAENREENGDEERESKGEEFHPMLNAASRGKFRAFDDDPGGTRAGFLVDSLGALPHII